MKKPNPRVGQHIGFRLRMKQRWEQDREGMLKRSKAGAKAMFVKSRHRREWWVNLFSAKARHLTKQEIVNSIISSINPEVESKPQSIMARLIRYGIIRFDDQAMDYVNNFSQE